MSIFPNGLDRIRMALYMAELPYVMSINADHSIEKNWEKDCQSVHDEVYIYCDVPGSPCLSKKGESNVRFVSF